MYQVDSAAFSCFVNDSFFITINIKRLALTKIALTSASYFEYIISFMVRPLGRAQQRTCIVKKS